MNDELFNDLLNSAEEASAIAEGRASVDTVSIYKGKVLVEIRRNDEVLWSFREAAERLQKRIPAECLPLVQPSPRHIRDSLNQTQAGFADLLGVSVETVRGWEQGKRQPRGPARTLLQVAASNPMAVLEAAGDHDD